jgi:hypothetical protein
MSNAPVHFSIPIAAWACAPRDGSGTGKPVGIDPLIRRRLSTLSKSTLALALECLRDRPAVRVVFSSRHGETTRTTEVLTALVQQTPLSPTSFSLSVLNAMTGVLGIVRGDRSAATAISAGPQSLGFALLEAYTQYAADPATPVLMVHGDEPVPSIYGRVDDDVREPEALALLIDGERPIGRLECTWQPMPSLACFDTQAQAVQHVLANKAAATWTGRDCHWRWSDGAN